MCRQPSDLEGFVKLFLPGHCCGYAHPGHGWVWRLGIWIGRLRVGLALRPSAGYTLQKWLTWSRR